MHAESILHVVLLKNFVLLYSIVGNCESRTIIALTDILVLHILHVIKLSHGSGA